MNRPLTPEEKDLLAQVGYGYQILLYEGLGFEDEATKEDATVVHVGVGSNPTFVAVTEKTGKRIFRSKEFMISTINL